MNENTLLLIACTSQAAIAAVIWFHLRGPSIREWARIVRWNLTGK